MQDINQAKKTGCTPCVSFWLYEGLSFVNYHTAGTTEATRAAIMTGNHFFDNLTLQGATNTETAWAGYTNQ